MSNTENYFNVFELTTKALEKRSSLRFSPSVDSVTSELNEGIQATLNNNLEKYKTLHLEAYTDATERLRQ